jgi:hypothetical protein
VHARMVLLHWPAFLARSGRIFAQSHTSLSSCTALSVPSSGSKSTGVHQGLQQGPGDLVTARRSATQAMAAARLAVCHSLSGALPGFCAPQLDTQLHTAALQTLGLAADACVARSGANVATVAVGANPGRYLAHRSDACDPDLLLLLEHGSHRCSDIHTDPCPQEVLRAAPVLQALFRVAAALLAEFPGNEILVQLCRLSARLASLHISTPLGKMLQALQLLLGKADEWQQHADRAHSMAPQMDSIKVALCLPPSFRSFVPFFFPSFDTLVCVSASTRSPTNNSELQ